MATFEKRVSADGAITWRAKIRRVGAKPISKTFARKTDTTGWARDIETQHDRGYGIPTPESLKRTVTAAIDRAVPGGRRALSYAELAFPPFEHLLYVGAIRRARSGLGESGAVSSSLSISANIGPSFACFAD